MLRINLDKDYHKRLRMAVNGEKSMSNEEKTNEERRSARQRSEKLGLDQASLTIALCGDEQNAKCASACELHESWKHLRSVAKARRKQGQPPITILRIACPGVCRFGPVAGIFPSGRWYGGCDPKTLDRIIEQHLQDNQSPDPKLEAKRIV